MSAWLSGTCLPPPTQGTPLGMIPRQLEARPRVSVPRPLAKQRADVLRAGELEQAFEEAHRLERRGLLGGHAHVIADHDLRLAVVELKHLEGLKVEERLAQHSE